MTDLNQNPPNEVTPSPAVQPGQIPNRLFSIFEKVKPVLIGTFKRLYSNKKIFWPVSIALCLVILIVILGLLFGKHTTSQIFLKTPTPVPVVQSTPEASPSGNILIDSQNKLTDLKNQINALDVKESRLQPPTLDFDIKFSIP